MSNVATITQRNISAGGKVSAIVPQTMDEAFRLATAICKSGMAPKGMDTPEKCMISIMRGMEVGLTPMMALDKIAIVNGRPVIWGDGALGLVRGSGLCEWVKEYMEGEGDNLAGVCIAKRRGEAEPVERRFSVSEAKQSGLWDKRGYNGAPTPWQLYPHRMLQMRARAFCLRDLFADVLGGLYLREEIEDEKPSAITHPIIIDKPDQAPPPVMIDGEIIISTDEQEQSDVVAVEMMIEALKLAETVPALNKWWRDNAKIIDGLRDNDRQQIIKAGASHKAKIQKQEEAND